MYRFIAKRYAKMRYRFNQEKEAETNMLHSALATRMTAEKRDLAAKLMKDADEIDATIKSMDEKLEKGFWECENGHENQQLCSCARQGDLAIVHSESCRLANAKESLCPNCNAPAKFIKRDQMTGQEKYESDKARGEAVEIAKQKRDQAKALEEEAANSEKTAKYFRELAQQNRGVADKIRRL